MMRRAVLLITMLVVPLWGCDGSDGAEDASREAQVRPVRVIEVSRERTTDIRHFPGTVQASQSSRISFQVPGRLERFPVAEGETVEEGALVAALDPTDYDLALRQARVEEDRLRKELARKRALHEDGHVAQATLDAAQAAYDQAEVSVEQAEQNLADATIRAPFPAIVAERLVDRFVNVQAGEPVVLLQDISALEVEVDVPERLIVEGRGDDLVEVYANLYAAPDRQFPLTLKEIATEPNPRTRTYTVTLSMDNPGDLQILPGMSATVTAHFLDQVGDAVSVPAGAVDSAPDGTFRVWIYDADSGTVRPRAVEVAALREGRAVIRSGLSGGETLVTAGVGYLAEGQKVRPVAPPDR